MTQRKVGNFKLFDSYSHYTPGWSGILVLILLFLAGSALGSALVSTMVKYLGRDVALEYGTLLSYPLSFVPAIVYVGYMSRRNALFETGFSLDSNHFEPLGGWVCALLVTVAVLATGFMTDLFCSWLPDMPVWLEEALKSVTSGKVWINLICVSLFAPVFEEWLCRGIILRGLLHSKKADGSKLMSPAWAIAVSALFFALIHFNPWQAIPAFILGSLFGYVYYRTGSLKLTMLMHCVNNSFSLILGHVDSLKDMTYWTDVLSPAKYAVIFAACLLALVLIVRAFSKIELISPEGNFDNSDSYTVK